MGVLLDIQTALDAKLNTLSPAISTCWPNTKFIPVENSSWIRPTLLPARATLETLVGAEYHKGIYQVDIFTPLEKGVSAMLTIADNIYTLFRKTTLTQNTHQIRIDAVGRSTPSSAGASRERQDAWLHGIVEIEFSCFDF